MIIIIIAVYMIFGYLIWREIRPKPKPNPRPPDKPPKRNYTEEMAQSIERIYYLNQQIKIVQEMLTELSLSGSNNLKNFSQEWETVSGKHFSADMWADGSSEVTKQLQLLAQKRLEELTASLFRELDKLSGNVVTKT